MCVTRQENARIRVISEKMPLCPSGSVLTGVLNALTLVLFNNDPGDFQSVLIAHERKSRQSRCFTGGVLDTPDPATYNLAGVYVGRASAGV